MYKRFKNRMKNQKIWYIIEQKGLKMEKEL